MKRKASRDFPFASLVSRRHARLEGSPPRKPGSRSQGYCSTKHEAKSFSFCSRERNSPHEATKLVFLLSLFVPSPTTPTTTTRVDPGQHTGLRKWAKNRGSLTRLTSIKDTSPLSVPRGKPRRFSIHPVEVVVSTRCSFTGECHLFDGDGVVASLMGVVWRERGV